jgi:hypothetical protein
LYSLLHEYFRRYNIKLINAQPEDAWRYNSQIWPLLSSECLLWKTPVTCFAKSRELLKPIESMISLSRRHGTSYENQLNVDIDNMIRVYDRDRIGRVIEALMQGISKGMRNCGEATKRGISLNASNEGEKIMMSSKYQKMFTKAKKPNAALTTN